MIAKYWLRIVAAVALLVTSFAGCVFNVEPEAKPPKKGGVDVKVERNKNGLDVDVDVKRRDTPKPETP